VGELRRRRRPARRRPARPLHQQPHLQRHLAEPVLRARRHPVGLRVGPVHGPHVRLAAGGRRRERRSPSTPTIRWRRSATTSARSRSPGRPPHRGRVSTTRRGSRSTRSRATSTGSASTAARRNASNGCGRDRSTGSSRTTVPGCSSTTATCRAGTRAATPLAPRRWRPTVASPAVWTEQWSPATSGRTRTSPSRRRTRSSRASTTGSSPRCRASRRGDEVRDRPPDRRR
jgi:hypothetical protein